MILSIESQIAAMGAAKPRFDLVRHEGRTALWRGALKPLLQTYQVEILYRAPLAVEQFTIRRIQPQVRIRAPALRPRRGDPEGHLPHVYIVGGDPNDVCLCLFDPDSDEWGPSERLCETTVPWTIEWLVAYEGWRATGAWTGTGRHLAQIEL